MTIRKHGQQEEGNQSRFADRFSSAPLRAAEELVQEPAGFAHLSVGIMLFAGAAAFRLWRVKGSVPRRRQMQQPESD